MEDWRWRGWPCCATKQQPISSEKCVCPLLPLLSQITVDGDTSTNDTVIGLASGAAGNSVITDASSKDGQVLEAALTALLQVRAKNQQGTVAAQIPAIPRKRCSVHRTQQIPAPDHVCGFGCWDLAFFPAGVCCH